MAASNGGPVKFSNCAFETGLQLAGNGPVLLTGCHVMGGGIHASSPLTVMGCDLGEHPIDIAAATPGAVIVGNQPLSMTSVLMRRFVPCPGYVEKPSIPRSAAFGRPYHG